MKRLKRLGSVMSLHKKQPLNPGYSNIIGSALPMPVPKQKTEKKLTQKQMFAEVKNDSKKTPTKK